MKPQNLKIAIFHDFFDSIGGGEKVAITLARNLKADLITNNLNKNSIKKTNSQDINFINLGNTIKIPPFKQLQASFNFKSCNFSKKYNFFIFSGNWAPFASKKNKPNLYYCHTPTRMFYEQHEHKQVLKIYEKPIFYLYANLHKKWGEKYIKHTNKIISNSQNVKKRIKKYFKRNSTTIFPPIETNKLKFSKPKNYYLSVNRIYPHKRIEMQIKAFKKIPNENLTIIGGIASGDRTEKYQKKILKNLPKNINLLGNIDEKQLIKLYSECKGFLTTSKDEDFGMNVVEAMASGKPVIAPNEGGYKESIINNKTGILIDNINEDKIIKAIKIINKNPIKYKNACINQAKKFDTKKFIKKIKQEIQNAIKQS